MYGYKNDNFPAVMLQKMGLMHMKELPVTNLRYDDLISLLSFILAS